MKRVFWALHGLFVVVGIMAIWVLAQDAPMSHPPPAVLIPIVILVWALLHLGIGIVQFLLNRGERRLSADSTNKKWPILLIVAVLIYILQISSLPGLIMGMVSSSHHLNVLQGIWLSVTLFTVVCLLSILLRWPIARYLAGAGLLSMTPVPLALLAMGVFSGHAFSMNELLNFTPFLLIVGLGIYLLRSQRIKDFFASESGEAVRKQY